jgi:hypothetical protein
MTLLADPGSRPTEQIPTLALTVAGRLLITEPQNVAREYWERIDLGYEQLEEAWAR